MSSFIYWYGGKVSDTVYLFFSDRPFFKHCLISEDIDKCIFDRASNRPLDWCKFWITLHNASKFVSWIISTFRFGYYCNIPVSCHEDVSAQQMGVSYKPKFGCFSLSFCHGFSEKVIQNYFFIFSFSLCLCQSSTFILLFLFLLYVLICSFSIISIFYSFLFTFSPFFSFIFALFFFSFSVVA